MRLSARTMILGAIGLAVAGLPIVTTTQVAQAADTGGGTTFRASVTTAGQQADRESTRARISADGKFVVYQAKSRLDPVDKDGFQDVYWTDLRDPYHPVTRRVSTPEGGGAPDNDSEFSEISGDGRFVAFSTEAGNLDGPSGIYVRDMFPPNPANALQRLAGGERPVISDDGRYVAYNTLPTSQSQIVVHDRVTGDRLFVTPPASASDGDGETFRPEISADGTHIVFASDLTSSQLGASGSDTNTGRDIYVADIRPWLANHSVTSVPIQLVSVGLNGSAVGSSSSRPGINGDGSVVAFQSPAGGLVSGDTNSAYDAFVRDFRENPPRTYLVSRKWDGTITTGDAESTRPQLDHSGNTVVFVSSAGQIVQGDTNSKEDAFIRNWRAAANTGNWLAGSYLLAVAPAGEPGFCAVMNTTGSPEGGKAISTRPYLSGDGKTAVFVAGHCNLTPSTAWGGPDTNGYADIFVRTFNPVGPPPPPPPPPPPTPSGVHYKALGAPARLLDTRGGPTVDGLGAGQGKLTAGQTIEVQVAGRASVPAGASAAVLNVTVTEANADGFITVYPCGAPRPTASNLNYVAGQTIPNAVVSKLGGGKVCLYALQGTHLVADVSGYFGDADQFKPLTAPARLLDTRGLPTADGQGSGGGKLPVGGVLTLKVGGRVGLGANTTSAVLNVTVTEPEGPGFITVYPCSQPRPLASSLNFTPGQTIPNAVVSKLDGNGNVCFFASGRTHLVVDAAGSFPTAQAFAPLSAPARLLDTRPEPTVDGQFSNVGKRAPGTVLALQVGGRAGIPADANAVVLNVTATEASGPGFVTVFPCGLPRPEASSLNVVAGQTIPNAVFARLGTNGQVCLFVLNGVHLVVDVTGRLV